MSGFYASYTLLDLKLLSCLVLQCCNYTGPDEGLCTDYETSDRACCFLRSCHRPGGCKSCRALCRWVSPELLSHRLELTTVGHESDLSRYFIFLQMMRRSWWSLPVALPWQLCTATSSKGCRTMASWHSTWARWWLWCAVATTSAWRSWRG